MARSRSQSANRPSKSKPAFDQRNYTWLAVGIFCIIFGFTAMRIENEIRGFISLYLAPVVIMAGYGIIAWAILLRPAAEAEQNTISSDSL